MKFNTLFILLISFFIFSSNLSGIDFKEGNWEIKMQMEMAGMPMQMPPVVMDECMTKEDMIIQQNKDESGCKVDKQIKGSTVSWTADCPDGKSVGKITYKYKSFKGKLSAEVKGENAMKMSYTMDGSYKGPCLK